MIRVLVIEEVRAVGEMIAAALQLEPDIEVVGQVTINLNEIKTAIPRCDVALLNPGQQSAPSIPLLRGIHQLASQTKLVIMGLVCAPSFVLQCVEAGVTSYVPRDSTLSDLLQTLRAAYHNEALVSPPVAAVLMSYITEVAENYQTAALRSELTLLTRREREVLTLIQQGLTNQEIAQSLVIELGTVKNHVHNILRKLNVNSRRDTLSLSRPAGESNLEMIRSAASAGNGNGKEKRNIVEGYAYPALAHAAPLNAPAR